MDHAHNINNSYSRNQEAYAEYQNILRSMYEHFGSIHHIYLKYQELLNNKGHTVAERNTLVELTKKAYLNGVAKLSELLESENIAAQSQISYIDLQVENFDNIMKILAVTNDKRSMKRILEESDAQYDLLYEVRD